MTYLLSSPHHKQHNNSHDPIYLTHSRLQNRIVHVKRAFLKGVFKINKDIYMIIPKGFKEYRPNDNTWLCIMSPFNAANNQASTILGKQNRSCMKMGSKEVMLTHSYFMIGEAKDWQFGLYWWMTNWSQHHQALLNEKKRCQKSLSV